MITEAIMEKLSPTGRLKFFGLTKVPLLFLTNPKVVKIDDEVCEVLIPLNKLTKNHVNSMYLGTHCIGADAAAAALLFDRVAKVSGTHNVVPLFKDLHADFLKRAEGDVVYRCAEGAKIDRMIKQTIETKERVTEGITVEAYTGGDCVAKFTLGLSVKVK